MTTLLLLAAVCFTSAADRWSITGRSSITWIVNGALPHTDHIEMSGLKVSTVVRYGVDEKGGFLLNRSVVWPMLRTLPNNTHASLTRRFAWDIPGMIEVNGLSLGQEQVKSITLDGTLTAVSDFLVSGGTLELKRILFPSVAHPAFCEKYVVRNHSSRPFTVEVPGARAVSQTDASKGLDGSYKLVATLGGQATRVLQPGDSLVFGVSFAGYKSGEAETPIDIERELQARRALVGSWQDNLILDTPSPILNTMFAFAKIRGAESIYDTEGGLMHGPGGESYYAAIWANDQAEYINPFFPYLGYGIGNESALNAFMLFARYMNPDYKPIPSSIIAEGKDTWNGAGDRGDAAMIAYGAARYALARGSREEARRLWPLIEWCLEYCRRKLNDDGVPASDSDELEGRFPAGKANLCTASLYYDALCSAAYLCKDMRISAAQARTYTREADALRRNINRYFGGRVEGFDTYHYYQGNDVLRAWICIPLTVGIYDRKEATIQALFSPRLWTENGLLTQAGTETFWDRSTLYALRGVYASGETERATDHLLDYSRKRLLGEHVPYAIEAWPEGNQRHLSAESGLYCRIITEGMFGIRPTGLSSFAFTPRLPHEWAYMNLNHIRAFGQDFSIAVKRTGDKLHATVTDKGGRKVLDRTVKEGTSLHVKF